MYVYATIICTYGIVCDVLILYNVGILEFQSKTRVIWRSMGFLKVTLMYYIVKRYSERSFRSHKLPASQCSGKTKPSTPPRLAKATPPAPPARGKLPQASRHVSLVVKWSVNLNHQIENLPQVGVKRNSICKKPPGCWHILPKLIETYVFTHTYIYI